MARLSVNINKIATLRNARGGNIPNLLMTALDIEEYGAEGITVHPRPDERHIRYSDVYELKKNIKTEFNIEGNPFPKFQELIADIIPNQVTLVPDPHNAITSNSGWDTKTHKEHLKKIINKFKEMGDIRVSIFVDPDPEMIYHAKETGTDRVELYTETYADEFPENPEKAISAFVKAAEAAQKVELGLNAGHDLNLDNLQYFAKNIPNLLEVSIGHSLISDALYYGLENIIPMYKSKLHH